jgi:DNA-binding protein YbaB
MDDPAAWLAGYQSDLNRTAAGAEAASARLRQVNGTSTSPRGEVEVRVSAGGALEDLRLTPAARAMEADQLARLIVATARQAQQQAGARILEIMTDYVGDGDVLGLIRQNLPAGAEELAAPAEDDDDYFANPRELYS